MSRNALALAIAFLWVASPSFAQSGLEQRVERLEQQLDGSALMSLMNQAETLRGEVTTLRGEIEQLQRQISDLKSQQREIYLDLDDRLLKMEAGSVSEDTTTHQSMTSDPTASEEAGRQDAEPSLSEDTTVRSDYDSAFAALRQGDYDAAVAAFEEFLTDHPDSELTANARYWLGESHYVVRQFDQALAHFQAVMDDYPESNKRPDALLKIGYVYYEQGQLDTAREALEQVIAEFPDATAANLANQRLDQM